MASKQKLTIHKLVFDIRVDDKAAYKYYANTISRMCTRTIPDAIDKVLEKYDLPEGNLVINKLSTNLGIINKNKFEKIIVKGITDQLENFFKHNIRSIRKEISQAKFKFSHGEKFSFSQPEFSFDSEIYLAKSVLLERELSASKKVDEFSLKKGINDITTLLSEQQRTESQEFTDLVKQLSRKEQEASLTEMNSETFKSLQEDQNKKLSKTKSPDTFDLSGSAEKVTDNIPGKTLAEITKQDIKYVNDLKSGEVSTTKKRGSKKVSLLDQIKSLKEIPNDLPPKVLTELDRAFLYFIRYGRLPSNIKYDLGMKMLDVFNVNQKDVRFFNELKKHIKRNDKAKERLLRVTDQSNKQSLIRKNIFQRSETIDFDNKTPKAFEDYFVALVLERDLSAFSTELQRYSLNDMVRFLYADHPQKLKAIIKFLLVDTGPKEETNQRIQALFDKLGKASIVKIIASFVRKAGFVNKVLNQLNKDNSTSVKAAHSSILLAFLTGQDPVSQLKKDGFKINIAEDVKIEPRVFLQVEPHFEFSHLTDIDLVNYFLTHGSLPHSSSKAIPTITQLSILILKLSAEELKSLPFFKNKLYENSLKYQSVGLLLENSIEHIIKTLVPNISKEILTKFKYFQIHIKSGVPDTFQKAFAIYYALRNRSMSYLEEMVNYWKKEFGDADSVIKSRWKVSKDLEAELGKLLYIKEESLDKQLEVDYEFKSYSKDISVKNAGLIILWPFLKVYFNMLDLLDSKGDFRSINERARACHLLQYLAVKQAEGEEFYFPLNKILTGYPLEEPLPYEIKMTEKEIDVSNALLKNVIKQWNALKGSSVDALRGSFLIRDGVLVPAPNGWLLTVEKKAYDILLDKLPWGIGMIKLSWAPYVLSVEWERNIM